MQTSEAGQGEAALTAPPRRADARRNHERVVAAAIELFAELGPQATVPQIAARAGVGKATVYRSFPAKEDLVEAIARLRLEELERDTEVALGETDPGRAFHAYVLRLFGNLARDRLLAGRLAEATSPAAGSVLTVLTEMMQAAKASGTVREDATLLDLRVILCGAALQLMTVAERDPAVWRRYGELVLQALRP